MLSESGSVLSDAQSIPSSPDDDSVDSPSSAASDTASINGYGHQVLRELGLTPLRTSSTESMQKKVNKSLIYTPTIEGGANASVLAVLAINVAEATGMSVNIIGIPQTGAKSRVETQIKLGIQLVTRTGKVTDYTHLRLPATMVAKERLRKGSLPTDSLPREDNQRVLRLEATVFCSSDPRKDVITCSSCIQRERKRSQRKKENRTTNGKLRDLGLGDDDILKREQKRVLLFNCTEYLDFSSGDAILPTRITCYCRHHGEKSGFKILFVMKDYSGATIATGVSPPIMITDDHKSSKKSLATTNNNGQLSMPPKGSSKSSRSSPVHDEEQSLLGKRRSINLSTVPYQKPQGRHSPGKQASNTHSVKQETHNVSHTLHPMQMAFLGKLDRDLTAQQVAAAVHLKELDGRNPSTGTSSPSLTSDSTNSQSHSTSAVSPSDVISQAAAAATGPSALSPGSLYPTSNHQPVSSAITPFPFTFDPQTFRMPSSGPVRITNHKQSPSMVSASINGAVAAAGHGLTDINIHFDSPSPNVNSDYLNLEGMEHVSIPKMQRMIPSEGPMHGGIEVTILGENFYNGLTCLFGENPSPTQFWSPTTLVCLLPPATSPGPVVVSFKEHPLSGLDGTDGVQLFTYQDDSDRALMELALQVVGLKMTGKLENAKQIAMRIVGGTDGRSPNGNNNNQSVGGGGQQRVNSLVLSRQQAVRAMAEVLQSQGGSGRTQDFESMLIQFLKLLDFDTKYSESISLRSRQGHTLLHLAVLLGFHRLVGDLIRRGIDVNVPDRNGYTALHFAAWMGRMQISRMLLDAAAHDHVCTFDGRTPVDLALRREQTDVATLLTSFKDVRCTETTSTDECDEDYVRRDSGVSNISLSSHSSFGETNIDVEEESMEILPWLEPYQDNSSDNAMEEEFIRPRLTRHKSTSSCNSNRRLRSRSQSRTSRTSSRSRRRGIVRHFTDDGISSMSSEIILMKMTTMTSDSESNQANEIGNEDIVDAELVSGSDEPNILSGSESEGKVGGLGDLANSSSIWLQKTLSHLHPSKRAFQMPTIPNIDDLKKATHLSFPAMPSMPSFKPSLPEFPSLPELPGVFAWQMSMPNMLWPTKPEDAVAMAAAAVASAASVTTGTTVMTDSDARKRNTHVSSGNRWWSIHGPKPVPMYRPEDNMQIVGCPAVVPDNEYNDGQQMMATEGTSASASGVSSSIVRPQKRWVAYNWFEAVRRPSEVPKMDRQLMEKLRAEQRKQEDHMLWRFWIPCLIGVVSLAIVRYSPLYEIILQAMDSMHPQGARTNPFGNSRYGI